MQTYQVFKRSATNFEEFSSARKMTVRTGDTLEQAREKCKALNENRTQAQIRKGTKLEFERE